MKNLDFLNTALSLLKPVHEEVAKPVSTVQVESVDGKPAVKPAPDFSSMELTVGDKVTIDFGNHFVGYFGMKLGFTGSHPDAPVLLRLRFAENATELLE